MPGSFIKCRQIFCVQWFMTIIPATQEVEAGGLRVQGQNPISKPKRAEGLSSGRVAFLTS
jgi:hypothetical protein